MTGIPKGVRVTCPHCQRELTATTKDCNVIQLDEWFLSVPCVYCGEQIIRRVQGELALLLALGGALSSDLALEAS